MIRSLLFLLLLFFTSCSTNKPYSFDEYNLSFFLPMPSSETNPVTVKGVALGRMLFYDPILSIDSTLSCSSCHRQEAAFSDGPKQFSSGRNELLTRNTPPLFNLAWYPALFWDGRAVSIEDQVFFPVRSHQEMGLNWPMATERIKNNAKYKRFFKKAFPEKSIDSSLIAKAIAQFERTLISVDSKYDRVLHGKEFFNQDEKDGLVIMNEMVQGDCMHCHTTDANALGTILKFSNNGLDTATNYNSYPDKGKGSISGKKEDMGLFKIPSLRNVFLTAPYMHDGRFKTLEEVIDFYSGGVHTGINTDPKMTHAKNGGVRLSDAQKKKVIAFLKTLSDSTFIKDSRFSSPFPKNKGN